MSDDNTRERIMLAAGPIFAIKGFRAATVREICDAANVNVASVNYYFGDKQKLYNETVILAREMRVKQVPYPKWDDTTKPEKKLHDFVSLLLNRLVALKTEPWQVRLLMRELTQPSEACKPLIRDYFSPFFNLLLTVIDELVGKKIDEAKRHQLGFSIIGQCLHYRFAANVTSLMIPEDVIETDFQSATLAKHITEFTLGGIERFKRELNESTREATKSFSAPKNH